MAKEKKNKQKAKPQEEPALENNEEMQPEESESGKQAESVSSAPEANGAESGEPEAEAQTAEDENGQAAKPEEKPAKPKREFKKPKIRLHVNFPYEKLKDRRVVTLGVFSAVALAMILLGILALKLPVVPVCALIVIEAVLAVLLHNMELWSHGMLLLAEVIAGILAGQIVFVVFCAIVYVTATISLQILVMEERAGRRKS